MSLNANEQNILSAVFIRLDEKVSIDVESGVLHAATVLAVFGIFRDVVRPLDPKLADSMVASGTENAAKHVAAEKGQG